MNGHRVSRQTARYAISRYVILGVSLALAGAIGLGGLQAFASDRGADDAARPVVLAQNAATDPAVARLEVKLAELERDLRASTGRVEELSHQVRQLTDRLEKLSADIDYRLGQAQGGTAGGAVAAAPAPGQAVPLAPPGPPSQPGSPPPPPPLASASPSPASPQPGPVAGPLDTPVAGEGPTVLGRLPGSEIAPAAPPGASTAPAPQPSTPAPFPPPASATTAGAALSTASPRDQYAYGFGLLRKANYDEAEVAFKQFLKDNPDDPLAENARYWLGETYYARGQYVPAAEAFLDAYQRSKTGPKAPDALLKLGLSLAKLDKIPEACATYDELRTALPDAPVSIKNRAQQERRALGCE